MGREIDRLLAIANDRSMECEYFKEEPYWLTVRATLALIADDPERALTLVRAALVCMGLTTDGEPVASALGDGVDHPQV